MTTAIAEAPAKPAYRFTADQLRRMGEAGIITTEGLSWAGGRLAHRFSRAEYHRMISLGILPEDSSAELIDGDVLAKMPQGDPHARVVEQLNRRLVRLLPDEVAVRCQLPVVIGESEPEPEFVLCVPFAQRGDGHPRPEHVFLIIEVSDSSLRGDQTWKLELYARAGIPVYWVVNLPDRRVEVYTDPDTTPGADPLYRTRADYGPGQAIPVVVAGVAVGTIPVDAILP